MTRIKKGDRVEKVVSSELVFKGKAVTLRKDVIELPDGRRSSREIIDHPGSVSIVPVLDDGRLVLIKQFRLATRGVIWEIPAGTMERGEKAEACARRELEEETGYRARKMELLFEAYLAPGYSVELMRFFMATGLEEREQKTDEEEIIEVKRLALRSVIRMIESNEIKDAKSIAAISYLRALGRI
jgi:ADP-ribose pyrophosphatase